MAKCPTMDQPLSKCPHCGRPPVSHWPNGECVSEEHWRKQNAAVRAAAAGDPGELGETEAFRSIESTDPAPSGLVVGAKGSGHVVVADRVPCPQTPTIRARLTPAEARAMARELEMMASAIEEEQARRECDAQREMAV